MPLDRLLGFMNTESLPLTLHFMIRSFGWSVKYTLPSGSQVAPSVNSNSPASFSTLAPGAVTLVISTGAGLLASESSSTITIRSWFMFNSPERAILADALSRSR